MAFTFGFYNSLDGDRKYNARQLSSIFDGIIVDGILFSIGERFNVLAAGGMTVTVGPGRAWFKSTWSDNDSRMPMTVRAAEPLLDRIDAVVLEIDARDQARLNSIRWVYGTPASTAQRPTLTKSAYVNQYPIAYVRILRGTTVITQADITSMIGTTDCPYVTAPLTTIDATAMLARWETQFNQMVSSQQSQWNVKMADYNNWKSAIDGWRDLTIAQLATIVAFMFENEIAYPGITVIMNDTVPDVITEEMRRTVGNALFARQVSTFKSDGSIEVVQHVYNPDNTLFRSNKAVTTFVNDLPRTEVTML